MGHTLDGLIESFLADEWHEWPEDASALGVDGYEDKLSEHSAEAYSRRDGQTDEWLRRFEGVDDEGLTHAEKTDRDLVISQLRGRVIMRDWEVWKRNPDRYLNPGLGSVFQLFLHRRLPEHDLARAAATRMKLIPSVLEEGKRNLDPALTPPLFVQRSLGVCAAAARYVRDLVPAEVPDDTDRDLLADAGAIAAAAYDDFAESLRRLEAEASGEWAIGEARYSAVLRDKELLGFDARELRERGQAEYDRLAAEMARRARDLRGTDDFVAVVEELNRDHPPTPEAMREAYQDWTERARAFLIEHDLVTIPDGEHCKVEPSPPFQRPVLAVASYNPPPLLTPDLTGHFFVPYPPEGTSDDEIQKRLESNSEIAIPTTAVHEAYPGHHWHLVWLKQNQRILPKVFWSSYFGEGWALYTEVMMMEQGFYENPRHELGVLDARIFRAARIIVDTSLHLGDMTFDEGVRFMMSKTGMAEPTARAEVSRYCTWPTQASSYLTGCMEIERMRADWLSAGRSLKDFHDTIAGSGALPIALAERALTA
jgi:uncharacterized protein (DUF885 family)